MLNCSASLAMSTSVLKALPGKLDIKRHSPSILYVFCLSRIGKTDGDRVQSTTEGGVQLTKRHLYSDVFSLSRIGKTDGDRVQSTTEGGV